METYGEYIFQQLIATDFIKRKLSIILISLVANLIQLHIVAIVSILTSINPYIDFWLQIIFSIILSLNINYIYSRVKRYKQHFYHVTTYLIRNYSIENYWRWKRIIVLSICAYGCVLLMLVKITNTLICIYIIQYAICFLIREQIERKIIHKFINDYRNRPSVLRLTDANITTFLIDDYITSMNTTKIIDAKYSGTIVGNGRFQNYGIIRRRK
jgi:hypothetical protein